MHDPRTKGKPESESIVRLILKLVTMWTFGITRGRWGQLRSDKHNEQQREEVGSDDFSPNKPSLRLWRANSR